MRYVTRCALVLGLAAGVAGCGDGRARVSGTVSLDGRPIPDGSITFAKAEGGATREGAVIKGGSFRADLPPGKYKVEVRAQKPSGKRKQKGFDGKEEEIELTEEMIPERFNTKTELTEDIKAGPCALKFELKSKN